LFHCFFFDLDGCIYRGSNPLRNVANAIKFIKSKGFKTIFLTNNATATTLEYLNKLRSMGVPAELNEILTSASATGIYLRNYLKCRRVYAVGGYSLEWELKRQGLKIVKNPSDCSVEALVACLDYSFNYRKLKNALTLLSRSKDLHIVFTNPDTTVPLERTIIPGAGSITNSLRVFLTKEPIVIGKPSKIILEIALSLVDLSADEVVLVGDRLETDILAANRMGIFSILVMTGVTSPSDVPDRNFKPDLVISSVSDIPKVLSPLLENQKV